MNERKAKAFVVKAAKYGSPSAVMMQVSQGIEKLQRAVRYNPSKINLDVMDRIIRELRSLSLHKDAEGSLNRSMKYLRQAWKDIDEYNRLTDEEDRYYASQDIAESLASANKYLKFTIRYQRRITGR